MKVILKSDVERVGQMGDLVEVADGYARNFLIPKSMAMLATNKNLKMLEHEKGVIAAQIRKRKLSSEEKARAISALNIEISVKVGEEGKLFGSVSSKDIVEAMAEKGVEIDKRQLLMERPIKEVGTFQIPVKIQHDVTASVKVSAVPVEETA
ncbi:MAG: 50S ribosomal protein L9 [Nitrospiria bacterium]